MVEVQRDLHFFQPPIGPKIGVAVTDEMGRRACVVSLGAYPSEAAALDAGVRHLGRNMGV